MFFLDDQYTRCKLYLNAYELFHILLLFLQIALKLLLSQSLQIFQQFLRNFYSTQVSFEFHAVIITSKKMKQTSFGVNSQVWTVRLFDSMFRRRTGFVPRFQLVERQMAVLGLVTRNERRKVSTELWPRFASPVRWVWPAFEEESATPGATVGLRDFGRGKRQRQSSCHVLRHGMGIGG